MSHYKKIQFRDERGGTIDAYLSQKKHCIILQKKKNCINSSFTHLVFFLPMEELRITVRKKGTNNKKKRKSYVKVKKKKKIVVVFVCDVLNKETQKKWPALFF